MYRVPPSFLSPIYLQSPIQWYQPYPNYLIPPYGMAPFFTYPHHYVQEVHRSSLVQDHGKQPYVVNIDQVTKMNNTYRTAIWTGEYLQVTVMSIPVGSDVGLEIHPDTDQFFRVEEGQGLVQMGKSKEQLDFQMYAHEDDAIMIPAGTWHNITNVGNTPLKLYSIYAPPHHPFGTVHATKEIAMAEED